MKSIFINITYKHYNTNHKSSNQKLTQTESFTSLSQAQQHQIQPTWWHCSLVRLKAYVANAVPSKPYRIYDTYVIQRRYTGIALNDTKKPLNNRKGTDITGARKTPFCGRKIKFNDNKVIILFEKAIVE